MDSDSFQVSIKSALIEAIMAETDMDLLDLISKILMAEHINQQAEMPKAG